MVNPSLPSPLTWSPGDVVTAPVLRGDLSNAVALLTGRPLFIGQSTITQSVPTATVTPVTWDTELTDTWAGHVPPATGDTDAGYFCPLPGWYLADTRIHWQYATATAAAFYAGCQGLSNGASFGPVYGPLAVNGSGQGTDSRSIDLIEQVNSGSPGGSGDYIQPVAYQATGSSVELANAAGTLPVTSIRWACALSGTASLPVPPLASCPSPITSAWLNANLRDTINFLAYPPCGKAVYTAGSATLANSSLTSPQVVPLTTADLDTYGAFTTGSSAKYTAPVAGRYLIAGQYTLATSSTTTYRACGLQVNGSTLYWGCIARFSGTTLAAGAGVAKRVRLNAGDYVQLVAAQASGSSIAYNTTAANQTRLIVLWEGE
jgi:hypothetical protein